MFRPALLSSLKTYTKQTFLADLFAGLTVGVVAIPLAMAFAIACGLSPTQGLITAIVAGFLISLFSGSKYQIGGPTGAFVIIIMGVLEQYHASGLLVCTLMAGLFLIILGFCRMGALVLLCGCCGESDPARSRPVGYQCPGAERRPLGIACGWKSGYFFPEFLG